MVKIVTLQGGKLIIRVNVRVLSWIQAYENEKTIGVLGIHNILTFLQHAKP